MRRTGSLFVYGTLRAGSPHPLARRLRDAAARRGRASWPGRLWDLGPYPAATAAPRGAGGRVRGDVFRLADEALLAALDAYEGCGPDGALGALGFVREAHRVTLDDGTRLVAWLYRYVHPPRGEPVPTGDWAPRLAGQP